MHATVSADMTAAAQPQAADSLHHGTWRDTAVGMLLLCYPWTRTPQCVSHLPLCHSQLPVACTHPAAAPARPLHLLLSAHPSCRRETWEDHLALL
jgi:hypothetical protein